MCSWMYYPREEDIGLMKIIFETLKQKPRGQKLNSKVSLSFFWPSLERQILITGNAFKISDQKSEKYFNERPLGNRIGAIVSPQSQIIPNRLFLENKIRSFSESNIKRPNYWGGYIVKPIFSSSGREDQIDFMIEQSMY